MRSTAEVVIQKGKSPENLTSRAVSAYFAMSEPQSGLYRVTIFRGIDTTTPTEPIVTRAALVPSSISDPTILEAINREVCDTALPEDGIELAEAVISDAEIILSNVNGPRSPWRAKFSGYCGNKQEVIKTLSEAGIAFS